MGCFYFCEVKINLKTEGPDGIEQGDYVMKYRKSIIVTLAITMLTTSVSYAQWGGILGGLLQAAGERYIENSGYSSQDKNNMREALNALSSEINTNQNARNAAKDAYEGNYTGAVIQGAQTLMNATGNYQYDTYLNSANQINNANREYKQDINNGMDRDAALDKRNTTIGYSAAESAIELQDKIARERAEKARQQREAERQSWGNDNYYSTQSYNEAKETTSSYNANSVKDTHDVPEESWQILRDYSSKHESDHSKNVDKTKSFNSNAKTLSTTNSVVFKTDDGEYIFLSIPFRYAGEGFFVSYNNQSSKAIHLCCNKASVKFKYYGNDKEQVYTGACSFVMPAHSDSKIALSAMFPNLLNASSIESLKVIFENTQITDEKGLNENKNSSNNSNGVGYNSDSDTHLLTKNRIVKLNTDEGTIVALGIDKESGRLFYNNMYNDKVVRFRCGKAIIKVKYVDADDEQTITDACSIVMPANTYDYLDWSDVFFGISDTKVIESIKVLFEETQVR